MREADVCELWLVVFVCPSTPLYWQPPFQRSWFSQKTFLKRVGPKFDGLVAGMHQWCDRFDDSSCQTSRCSTWISILRRVTVQRLSVFGHKTTDEHCYG